MATNNSYINALVGAAVTVVLSFIPFSPLLGGCVAGALERRDGARIGFFAGVLASLPLFLMLFLAGGAVAVIPRMAPEFAGSLIIVALLVVLLLGTYAIALSTLGGVVGVYLGEEFLGRDDDSPDGQR